MGKIVAVLIAIAMLVGCSTADYSSYYKEMNAVNTEFNDAIGFVTNAIENETDNGEFRSKMDFAASKLRQLSRKVKGLTPPEEMEKEHGYYVELIDSATRAVISVDVDAYNKELKEGARMKKLAQPLIDKFQGE